MPASHERRKLLSRSQSQRLYFPPNFVPYPYSVQCGHGKIYQQSIGCQRLRVTCQIYVSRYKKANSKQMKTDLVTEIVSLYENSVPHPDYAFIRRSSDDGRWYCVPALTARDKVGQVMRDLLAEKYRSSTGSKLARRRMKKEKFAQFYVECEEAQKGLGLANQAASTTTEDERAAIQLQIQKSSQVTEKRALYEVKRRRLLPVASMRRKSLLGGEPRIAREGSASAEPRITKDGSANGTLLSASSVLLQLSRGKGLSPSTASGDVAHSRSRMASQPLGDEVALRTRGERIKRAGVVPDPILSQIGGTKREVVPMAVMLRKLIAEGRIGRW